MLAHLVVVLASQFPVLVAIGGPGALVNIVIEVEILETFLLVGTLVELFPWDGAV